MSVTTLTRDRTRRNDQSRESSLVMAVAAFLSDGRPHRRPMSHFDPPTRRRGVRRLYVPAGATTASGRPETVLRVTRRMPPASAALLELVLVAVLYVAYTTSRLLADDNVSAAVGRAVWIHRVEERLGLAWESVANHWLASHDLTGLLASYWYCTAHYALTAGVLVWLYSRGAAIYRPARRALAVTTVLGLASYLAIPTAPPRLIGGFVDVLSLHANAGWWGADASAPRGLGNLTNQLAAFPSLHAGWSLWVALAVAGATRSRALRGAAWTQAATTAAVVVGTANHWTADVLVGWAVTWTVWALCHRSPRPSEHGRLRGEVVVDDHLWRGHPDRLASSLGGRPSDRVSAFCTDVAEFVHDGSCGKPTGATSPAQRDDGPCRSRAVQRPGGWSSATSCGERWGSAAQTPSERPRQHGCPLTPQ